MNKNTKSQIEEKLKDAKERAEIAQEKQKTKDVKKLKTLDELLKEKP